MEELSLAAYPSGGQMGNTGENPFHQKDSTMARMNAIKSGIFVSIAIVFVLMGRLSLGQTAEMDTASPSFVLEAASELTTPRPSLSLDGAWDFSYDPQNVGEQEQWFIPTTTALKERTMVPGCAQAADHPSAGCARPTTPSFTRSKANS